MSSLHIKLENFTFTFYI